MNKTCTKCREAKPLTEFTPHPTCRLGVNSVCRGCTNRRHKAYVQANKPAHKARCRRWELKTLYGVTPERYQELFEKQNGNCAICGGTNPEGGLCVDHNHATGKVRNLLCRSCNLLIGNAREQVELLIKAAAYLNSHSER